ncbi:TPA: biosynthetic-type acetolactate synthase large subunit [Candidatus Bathyarchaeota archaeon]|nr:biosynthetic-type acetolactate synthase large subunit [Candidatus Bathyarchaeota archaeon]
MPRITGAKALLKAFEAEGVKVIFGIPGGAIMPVYDELLNSPIRHVLTRHEQAAAHMADGYARASGKVGVCMATSGPGATNLVTGIATAYMDSSPLVAATGQIPTSMIGRDAFQEADIIGITASITKHNFQPRRPGEIPYMVKAAFKIANTPRRGPVLIDLPRDVQVGEAEIGFPSRVEEYPRQHFPDSPPEDAVKEAAELLLKAEKPIILAGGGVIAANASAELKSLVERLRAPLAIALMAKGCFPEDHPLYLGLLGMHGMPYANMALIEADTVMAVGFRFSDRTITADMSLRKDANLIHADIDVAEIDKNVPVSLPLVGDARKTLRALLNQIRGKVKHGRTKNWLKHLEKLKRKHGLPYKDTSERKGYLKPPRLMKEIRELLPRKGIVVTEVGQNQMWAALYLKVYHPRTFLSSGGLGTMGFGFPAALGAKVAQPDVPVVDVAGDGSFLMNERELATSVKEKIPVIVVIIDNRVLGMVAQWQRHLYAGRYSEVHLGAVPDFVKLAEAYGAQGVKVESYREFRKVFKEALKSDVTTVIDVPVSSEENVYPINLPKSLIKTAIQPPT